MVLNEAMHTLKTSLLFSLQMLLVGCVRDNDEYDGGADLVRLVDVPRARPTPTDVGPDAPALEASVVDASFEDLDATDFGGDDDWPAFDASRPIRRVRPRRDAGLPAPDPPDVLPIISYPFTRLPPTATDESYPSQIASVLREIAPLLAERERCATDACREALRYRLAGPVGHPSRVAIACQASDVLSNTAIAIQGFCLDPETQSRCARHCAPGRYADALRYWGPIMSLCAPRVPRSLPDVIAACNH